MPSVNVLRNINLANERRGGSSCPNTSLYPVQFCGTPELTYTALSLDEENQKWYQTNVSGGFTPDTGSYGTITGSASLVKIYENGCPYPAVYFSGSAAFQMSGVSINLGIVTGSFQVTGSASSGQNWSLLVSYQNTGSIAIFGTTQGDWTTKNALVGIKLGTYVSPGNFRDIYTFTSGSNVATGSTPINFPYDLGTEFTLQGEGIIRSFGFPEGTTSQQTQYNCLYGSTPKK